MVEAEEVEDRGVEVVDADPILDCFVAEFVARTMRHAPLHASSCQPHRESVRVVVAAGLIPLLRDREAAELPSPDNERLVEEPAPVEILQERRDRAVGLGGEAGMVAADVGMAVPALLVLLTTGIDLHESHAALHEAPGGQALPGEMAAGGVVEAVEIERLAGFGGEIEGLRGGHLHPVGELVALDPGLDLAIGAGPVAVAGIEPRGEVKLGPLLVVGHRRAAGEVGDRRASGVEARSLERAWQKASRPVLRIALGEPPPLRVDHDDEAGKIAVLTPQAVGHPAASAGGADARIAGIQTEERGGMVI